MAYALYESEKFTESQGKIDQVILKYPKDAMIPKLNLLNAFNAGKTSGKEVMILQLEQIVLNYAKTPEGLKAKEMLNYLKSDLAFKATDNKGNAVQNSPFNGPGKPTNIPQNNQNNIAPGNKQMQMNNNSQMMNNNPQNNNNMKKSVQMQKIEAPVEAKPMNK